jgi:plastocyanin
MLGAAAALAVGLAACGDDDEQTASTTTETETVVPTVTQTVVVQNKINLAVSMTEFAFDPANPTIKPGIVTITATNDGTIDHAVTVEAPNGNVSTPTVMPGDSAKIKLKLPPGTYDWFCPIGNHEAQGMKGTITVKS